jgi:hypothetical protein
MRIFALSWARAVAHDHIFLLGVSTGVGTRILVTVRSTHDHIFILGLGVSIGIGIGTRILVTVTRRHGSLSMG